MLRPSTLALLLAATTALGTACTAPGAAPSPAQGSAVTVSAENAPEAVPAAPAAASPAESCGGEACGACAEQACGEGTSPVPAEHAALRRVSSEEVCMRANRFLGKRQLSTELDGHTYFSCCAGCSKHLTENAAARQAKDPVTGKLVDKASAVIGARPDGSVVYFESHETFARAGGA